jgi:hypothetical protein
MPRSAGRRGSVLVLVPVLASLVLALLAPSAVAAASHPAVERAKVIVMFQGPPGKAAERAIEKYGGKVDKKLALVNGLAARVPKGQLKQLAKEPGVKTVEPDVTVQAFDLEYDNAWGVKRSARRPSTRRASWATASRSRSSIRASTTSTTTPTTSPTSSTPSSSTTTRAATTS